MTDKPVFVIVSGSLCCIFGSELFASLSPLRTIERDQHTVSQKPDKEKGWVECATMDFHPVQMTSLVDSMKSIGQ